MKKTFNKLIQFLLFTFSLVFLAGCDEEPSVKPVNPPTPSLPQDTVYFAAKGTTKEISVPTGFGWREYLCEASWVVDITPAGYGSTISFTLQPNESTTERTAQIIVSVDEIAKRTVLIWQYGKNAIMPTSAPYSIGDIYFENGAAGIVYKVTNDGKHGMIVSLTDTVCNWAKRYQETGCTDLSNGVNNMNAIKQIENWQSLYPPFKWCDEWNVGGVTGWYFPAIGEMRDLYAGFSGLSKYMGVNVDADILYRTARNKFNRTLLFCDGDEIKQSYYYVSSSEHNETNGYYDNSRVWYIELLLGISHNGDKFGFGRIRAVRAF